MIRIIKYEILMVSVCEMYIEMNYSSLSRRKSKFVNQCQFCLSIRTPTFKQKVNSIGELDLHLCIDPFDLRITVLLLKYSDYCKSFTLYKVCLRTHLHRTTSMCLVVSYSNNGAI